jgi:hypothetical protein
MYLTKQLKNAQRNYDNGLKREQAVIARWRRLKSKRYIDKKTGKNRYLAFKRRNWGMMRRCKNVCAKKLCYKLDADHGACRALGKAQKLKKCWNPNNAKLPGKKIRRGRRVYFRTNFAEYVKRRWVCWQERPSAARPAQAFGNITNSTDLGETDSLSSQRSMSKSTSSIFKSLAGTSSQRMMSKAKPKPPPKPHTNSSGANSTLIKLLLGGTSSDAVKGLGIKLSSRPPLEYLLYKGDDGTGRTPTDKDWANKYCEGTCGLMCGKKGGKRTRFRPTQTKLVTYVGAEEISAINTRTIVMSNGATQSIARIDLSLAYKCSDLMAKLGRVYLAFAAWKNSHDDGKLMSSPPNGGKSHVVELKTPASRWLLQMYQKKNKITEGGVTAHLIKNLFCAKEVDSSNNPLQEEACCVDKTLTPLSAAKNPALVAALKAW